MAINVIRLPKVITKTGLSRATIYALVKAGQFPKQIKLGSRSVGWVESEIDSWLEQQLDQRG
ncbi:helix-turn-helix transcriptional regulator [Ferrimonas marina]|uniref:Transcriptional regulator, AlpA family n=1 Tax=Ferrimonas marina TaxID=299255 RepID=A0A1M5X7Z0_9GAMM|nr:AlpA family transcriptional regulator [Ferrimonas marina]SHH95945.1 transcriptional regulator, AlpA family [Ferrimonas marina]